MKHLLSSAVLLLFALAGSPSQAQTAFAPQVAYVVGSQPAASALGDFDGDGDLDVAVTSDAPDKVTIHANDGAGVLTLVQVVPLGSGSGPRSIAAADLDGDGDVDLAVTLSSVAAVTVLLNNSGMFLTTATLLPVGLEPRSLIALDLDADGDADLVTSNRDANTISILKNDGNLSFQPAVTIPVGMNPRHVTSGDFDGDGDRDLAVADNDSHNLAVLLNDGTGAFGAPTFLTLGSFKPEGIVAADLDADGDVDLATSSDDDTLPNAVNVFLNGGSANFTGPFNHVIGGSEPGFLAASDLDLDGDLELVTANVGTNDTSVLPNTQAGTFGTPQVFAVEAGPGHVVAGDLTGDGAPDLVVANGAGTTISVLVNRTPVGSIDLLTPPIIGTAAAIQLAMPQDGGKSFICGFSLGTAPGFNLADGRHVPLNPDALLTLSLTPNNGLFYNNVGTLNGSGYAVVMIVVPNLPQLIGQTAFMACVILNSAAPLGIEQISAPFPIPFQ